MSIPKIEPKITMEDVQKVGARWLEVGYEYWEICHKAGISGAVIWIRAEDGHTCIFTRGEYAQHMLNVVERHGPTINFGALKD